MKAMMSGKFWTVFGWAAMVTVIRHYFAYMDRFQAAMEIDAASVVEPVANVLRVASFGGF